MRYSFAPPKKPAAAGTKRDSNADFFRKALEKSRHDLGPGALLLVGGNDVKALALRRAQASIRLDRRTSPWSHAALVVRWDPEDVGRSEGLEVAVDPADGALQVPERNGVTPFLLSRYLDGAEYPNVFVGFPTFRKEIAEDRLQKLRDALAHPHADRSRYPFWELLGRWSRYAYTIDGDINPLSDNLPMPSAAYCEYVYATAQIDLTPSATGNYAAPEVLYATLQYWSSGLEDVDGVAFKTFELIRDEDGKPRAKLSKDFEDYVFR